MDYEMGKRTDHKPAKSYMPRGATQSPTGDLGDKHERELHSVFPRPIKRSGTNEKNPLHYRKPASANDSGGTSGGHA